MKHDSSTRSCDSIDDKKSSSKETTMIDLRHEHLGLGERFNFSSNFPLKVAEGLLMGR